ncbi:MAG: MarR family winged helix-turn-helix transcriptional regulator [Eggerthellaceae bacterium]|jgi:DNA-binding MarR family transcriptional regulator
MEPQAALVKTLDALLEKRANNDLRKDGLTLSQIGMLLACQEAGGSCTLKQLERILKLSQPTVAGTAKRLEAKGLLLGSTDPDDGRVKRVRLSDAGADCCVISRTRMRETNEQLVSGFTPREQQEFSRLLEKAIQNCS